MNTSWNTKPYRAAWSDLCKVAAALMLIACLCVMAADTVQAQQIPRRLNSLQLIRPIAPAPVPPVERLRQDIIRSVDPRTGKIDVRELAEPFLQQSRLPSNVSGRPVAPNTPFLWESQGRSNVRRKSVPPGTPFLSQ